MSMNIYAPKGPKVRFVNRGAWVGEYERAAEVLEHGKVYTVKVLVLRHHCLLFC